MNAEQSFKTAQLVKVSLPIENMRHIERAIYVKHKNF
jgi:hypothetical protein